MKSKNEFYIAFYEQLAMQKIEAKKSTSADYIADLWHNGQNIAFFTKAEHIVKNPFVEVSDKVMDAVRETARSTALKCGICSVQPYDENKNEKFLNGAYKLNEFNGTVLACKHHHLFDYVFSTYKQTPESGEPIQRQFFYNKNDALQDFAIRSGLVDERQFFNTDELTAIHENLVKRRITPDNDMFHHELQALDAIVEKIEKIMPELADKEISLELDHDLLNENEGVEP